MPHVAVKKIEDRGEVFNPGDVIPGVEGWPTFRELKSLGWVELVEESGLKEFRQQLANPPVVTVPDIKLTPLPPDEERDPNRIADATLEPMPQPEPIVQTQTPMRGQVAVRQPPVRKMMTRKEVEDGREEPAGNGDGGSES
jgi:hypothetical protein